MHLLPPEIPGDFTLIDDVEKKLLASQVLSEIMADYYEQNDEDFIFLLECYGKGSDDEKIGGLILGLYNFLVSIPETMPMATPATVPEMISGGRYRAIAALSITMQAAIICPTL